MPEISRNRQNARYAEDVVNVKDFGAVGDGVTDDTTAIQDATTFADGKPVLFPRGEYRIASSLLYTDSLVWVGEGMPDNATMLGSGSKGSVVKFDTGFNLTPDGS